MEKDRRRNREKQGGQKEREREKNRDRKKDVYAYRKGVWGGSGGGGATFVWLGLSFDNILLPLSFLSTCSKRYLLYRGPRNVFVVAARGRFVCSLVLLVHTQL